MTSDDYVEYHNNHCPIFLATRHCYCWLPEVSKED
jgi:hypothetical protein